MFKFVAAATLTSIVAAVDLQEASQDLVEVENQASSTVEVAAEWQPARPQPSLSAAPAKVREELQKVFALVMNLVSQSKFANSREAKLMGMAVHFFATELGKENFSKAKAIFYSKFRPLLYRGANTPGKRAMAII